MKSLKAYVNTGAILMAISGAIIWWSSAVANGPTMINSHDAEIIAVVNGDSLSTMDLARLLVQVHQNLPADQRADYDYNRLATKLINDRLIIQEATQMGMDQEEMVTLPVEKFRLSNAVSAFVKVVYDPKPVVSDEAIQARFGNNYKRAQVRTIAVATKEEADQIYQVVSDGGSMDSIARELSFDSQAKEGGLHKPKFWKDILVGLRLQINKLDIGEVAKPFRFEEAYMVLRLEKIEPANQEIYGHAEAAIRRSLMIDQRKRAWEGLLDSLRLIYPVAVNEITLASIKADSGVLLSSEFTIKSHSPVLTIKDMTPVDEARFRKTLSHKAMTAAEDGFASQVEITIKELTESYLLEAGATLGGFLDNTSVISKVNHMRDSLIIEKYLLENIATRIIYDDAELQAIYDEDTELWQVAGDVKLEVMLCPDKETIEKALEMLRDGANFDYVNNHYGIDNDYNATANNWREVKSLPFDLTEKIKHISVGSFADGAYQLTDGFGIFRLTARKPDQQRSFEEVMPNLRSMYFQREFRVLVDQLLETLKENSTIDIYEDRIDKFLEG